MEIYSSKNQSEIGLSSNSIKLIAIVAMTLDHIAWILFPGYSLNLVAILFHAIGRITAPIMWFFIAEGFYRSRNLKKYACRLFIFALISHFAFNWFSGNSFIPFRNSIYNQTSIIWGLFCGLLLLILYLKLNAAIFLKFLFVVIMALLSFPADWTFIAPLTILLLGLNHENRKKQMYALAIMLVLFSIIYFIYFDKVYGIIQLCSLLSIPFLLSYNGKRGKTNKIKWFFYVYYPLHLAILKLVQLIVI